MSKEKQTKPGDQKRKQAGISEAVLDLFAKQITYLLWLRKQDEAVPFVGNWFDQLKHNLEKHNRLDKTTSPEDVVEDELWLTAGEIDLQKLLRFLFRGDAEVAEEACIHFSMYPSEIYPHKAKKQFQGAF